MMTREQHLKAVLGVVSEFANRAFQERVWLTGAGPEVSSFEEAICRFFDDYDAVGLISSLETTHELRTDQVEALKKFSDELNSFAANVPDGSGADKILRDPQWESLRQLAENVLSRFQSR